MIKLGTLPQQIQQIAQDTPTWANWIIIAGSAVLSWLSPLASLVAIIWGCIQIYTWAVNKGWRPKGKQ
jgi:hypothetical protein